MFLERLENARMKMLEIVNTRTDGELYLPLLVRLDREIESIKAEASDSANLMAKYRAEFQKIQSGGAPSEV
ncbi:hypothetical protein ACFORG_20405 [Lutimaribacter marinistellae]|uniref:Uncharacterized protein n=1 Tax=Lutimaribacter marinistellae TaxID=1820329 RepID=A0ABV7TMV6_9RHOB